MVPSSSIKAFEGMGCVHVSFSSGGGLGGFRLPASALSLLRQQMALIRNILVPSPRFFFIRNVLVRSPAAFGYFGLVRRLLNCCT